MPWSIGKNKNKINRVKSTFMRLGLGNIVRKIWIVKNKASFKIRKRIFGISNALIYFSNIDKNSVIPILQSNGAKIGDNCDIETGITFHNCVDFKKLIIGNNCHIGKNCFIDLREKVEIENNVVVSMQTMFITHVDMNKSNLKNKYPVGQKEIKLESNSYIGARATILMGVTIGNSSIVAAGSLVKNNVDACSLSAGNPAIPKKKININT